MRTVYFDYNATTPLDAQVREAMLPYLDEIWGNPSSVHHVGRQARALLDDARDRAAQALGCKPSEIIFTSGGTESVNLAIFGTARSLKSKGRHLITSAVEHHAVLHCCEYLAKKEGFELTVLPVDRYGLVLPETLERALQTQSDTILVSIMWVSNEVGTVQPIDEIRELTRGVLLHTDAAQAVGKIPVDARGCDLLTLSAHKIYGPKGVGALRVRKGTPLSPLLVGGGQEF